MEKCKIAYNGKMKRLLLFTFVLIFAFNTLSLSAFAFDCPDGGDTITMKMKALAKAAQPPCPMHQSKGAIPEKDKKDPCGGLCLCMHALHAQVLYTPDMIGLPLPVLSAGQWHPVSDHLSSLSILPLRRPPKTLS